MRLCILEGADLPCMTRIGLSSIWILRCLPELLLAEGLDRVNLNIGPSLSQKTQFGPIKIASAADMFYNSIGASRSGQGLGLADSLLRTPYIGKSDRK